MVITVFQLAIAEGVDSKYISKKWEFIIILSMDCLPDIIEEFRQVCHSNGIPEERADILEAVLYRYQKEIQEETRAQVTSPMRFGKYEKLIIRIALSGCDKMNSRFLKDLTNVMIHVGYRVYEERKLRIRQLIEYVKRRDQLSKLTLPSRVVNNDHATPPEDACTSMPTIQFNADISALPSIDDDAKSSVLFARIGIAIPSTGISNNHPVPLSLSNPNGTTFPSTAVSDNSPASPLLLNPNSETSSNDLSIPLSPISIQHSLFSNSRCILRL